jgi:hypothetical protein
MPRLVRVCGGGRRDWLGSMPLARYFTYTGGALLALLVLLNWYLPPAAVEAARADVDRSTIRLQTRHKWPSAVVFDTNQPTIVPPATVAELVPPARPPREAMAMVERKEPSPVVAAAPAAAPKRVVRRAKARQAPPAPQIAGGYDMFGFRNSFPGSW